jgi:hypothetical protein
MGAFSKHSSLNFDMMRAKIFEDKEEDTVYNWIAHGLTGVLTGFFAVLI